MGSARTSPRWPKGEPIYKDGKSGSLSLIAIPRANPEFLPIIGVIITARLVTIPAKLVKMKTLLSLRSVFGILPSIGILVLTWMPVYGQWDRVPAGTVPRGPDGKPEPFGAGATIAGNHEPVCSKPGLRISGTLDRLTEDL